MTNPLLQKFARTLVQYSLGVQPGDIVAIRTTTLALDLLREVYREVLHAGAHLISHLGFDGEEAIFSREADREQAQWESPVERAEIEHIHAYLGISAPFNTRTGTLSGTPLRKPGRSAAYSRRYRERQAAGELRTTLTLFPTHALAQEAGLSLEEYREFVYRAMFLDRDDPAGAWQAFSAEQQKKVELLDGVETLRIVAPDTDLALKVAGRRWMNSDGHRNFPSGEVFTGPVEESAEGHIRFTFPAVRDGYEVEDVRLWFERGRVVRAEAARGQAQLLHALDTDAGARYLGEVAIGNNYGIQRFTKNILFDEKIGGTCHLAVGQSYAETGGRNESAVHWDMVCDLRQGGAIYADGTLIHENGQWKV